MSKIPLVNSYKYCLIDNKDYPTVCKHRWYIVKTPRTNYAKTCVKTENGWKTILMHRLILGLKTGDKAEGDHRNHNGLDNRQCNIHKVNRSENSYNRQFVKGYYWSKPLQKWYAQFKRKHLGCFNNKHQASLAYCNAKLERLICE